MKILILGATGAAGTRLTAETLRRGHEVTAASRSIRPGFIGRAQSAVLDGSSAAHVADLAQEHDVVIGATRPAPGREEDIDVVTAGIAEGTRRAGRRLVVVGAAPLRIPGTSWSALEDPVWVPRRFRAFAAPSSRQLESPTTPRGILSIGR
ncbi:NAD(P)H-binding protein [Brachybacterium sp. J144]|uniref:NAD(P)-dependent oxidoreductase n=1 Tax=Brachybacterium sp. J144 TaxID=3116487 RepID=UPI002E77FBB8|nr:NAD(P)H-binding protein [Brachybacterium sp. J144]MEE1651229.1 NAD(P)H-binding protein [Brachybacterium sp. J144]